MAGLGYKEEKPQQMSGTGDNFDKENNLDLQEDLGDKSIGGMGP